MNPQTQKKLAAWLEKHGFQQKNLYIWEKQDGEVIIGVNLSTNVPVIGKVMPDGEILEEGHGISRIEDYQSEILEVFEASEKLQVPIEKKYICSGCGKEISKEQAEKSAEKHDFQGRYCEACEAAGNTTSNLPAKPKKALPNTETLPAPHPQTGFLSPATTIEEAILAFSVFEDAKTRLLSDKDVLWIGANGTPVKKGEGHPHIKRSGWRKLARFFGINCSILEKEKILSHDSEGDFYIWKFRVRAQHPSGGYFEADGVCSSRDPFFSKKKGVRIEPDEADIILKAQTVAFNRAVSDLLGSGEVSADEVER